MTNTTQQKTLFTALQEILGDRAVQDDTARNEHGAGYSYHDCMPPDAVVYPQSTEEVAAIVKVCSKYKTPIVPFGAGTSLEGHVAALKGGVCIDMKLMAQVHEINVADMYATVQAGVTRNQLDEALKESGFFFPIGPGINASLGGMASTRASGTNAVRYGTMKDNVLAMKVVLPNGEIIKTGSKAKKSSTGYDLTRLFIGSEGTLGIITELTLKLHAVPEEIYAAVCSFPSVEAAVNTTIKTIQKGVPIARIELLDAALMQAINRYSKLNYAEKPTLFLEFHGTAAELNEQIDKVQQYAQEFGGAGFIWEKNAASREKLWQARTDATYAVIDLVPGAHNMSSDVCVPISKLAQCIVETQKDIKATGLFAPILGHVGDGNFHLIIPMLPGDTATFEKAKALNKRLVQRALAMEGTCSGEHGIGIGKLQYMQAEHQEALGAMRTIKKAFDPDNLMNPGKLLPVDK